MQNYSMLKFWNVIELKDIWLLYTFGNSLYSSFCNMDTVFSIYSNKHPGASTFIYQISCLISQISQISRLIYQISRLKHTNFQQNVHFEHITKQ